MRQAFGALHYCVRNLTHLWYYCYLRSIQMQHNRSHTICLEHRIFHRKRKMTSNFDTETILQEMLAVLEKHAVPVKSVALNLSFLSQDFEATFPHIKEYKAGRFY